MAISDGARLCEAQHVASEKVLKFSCLLLSDVLRLTEARSVHCSLVQT